MSVSTSRNSIAKFRHVVDPTRPPVLLRAARVHVAILSRRLLPSPSRAVSNLYLGKSLKCLAMHRSTCSSVFLRPSCRRFGGGCDGSAVSMRRAAREEGREDEDAAADDAAACLAAGAAPAAMDEAAPPDASTWRRAAALAGAFFPGGIAKRTMANLGVLAERLRDMRHGCRR